MALPTDTSSKNETSWQQWRLVRVTVAAWQRVIGLFRPASSVVEQRVVEKKRQKGIRRKLRGLPDDS